LGFKKVIRQKSGGDASEWSGQESAREKRKGKEKKNHQGGPCAERKKGSVVPNTGEKKNGSRGKKHTERDETHHFPNRKEKSVTLQTIKRQTTKKPVQNVPPPRDQT